MNFKGAKRKSLTRIQLEKLVPGDVPFRTVGTTGIRTNGKVSFVRRTIAGEGVKCVATLLDVNGKSIRFIAASWFELAVKMGLT